MENYESKQELVKQAKELAESDNLADLAGKVKALKKKFGRPDEDASFAEEQLADQFYGYLDTITKKMGVAKSSVEDAKKAVVAKANAIVADNNFKKGTEAMAALMDEWKATGRGDKESDDALWAEFKAARDTFFANKKAYYDELTAKFANNKAAKEALVEEAKKVAEDTSRAAGSKMKSLMDEWKKLGSAGKKEDDALWAAFNAERQAFYAKMNEVYAGRVAAKNELITKAKRLLANSEFTAEEVNAVKNLRNEWKEIGNAGKEEDGLWKEFNERVQMYFDHLKAERKN